MFYSLHVLADLFISGMQSTACITSSCDKTSCCLGMIKYVMFLISVKSPCCLQNKFTADTKGCCPGCPFCYHVLYII